MSAHLVTLEIADRIVARWKLWRALQIQAQERGETVQELEVRELWEPKDEATLREWENHKAALSGAVPLPLDIHPDDLEGLACAI